MKTILTLLLSLLCLSSFAAFPLPVAMSRTHTVVTSGGGGTFDPATVTGIVAYHKVESLSALSNGATLTGWIDSSVNGNDLTSSRILFPKYNTAVTSNGKAVVRFSTAGVTTINSATYGAAITQPYTIWTVGRFTGASSGYPFTDGISGNRAIVPYINAGPVDCLFMGGGLVDGSSVTQNTFYIWCAYANGAGSKLYRNGVDTGLSGNPGSNALGGLTVGAAFDNSSFLDGDICCVIIYSGNVSIGTTDGNLIQSFLSDSVTGYGIP